MRSTCIKVHCDGHGPTRAMRLTRLTLHTVSMTALHAVPAHKLAQQASCALQTRQGRKVGRSMLAGMLQSDRCVDACSARPSGLLLRKGLAACALAFHRAC